MRLFVFSTLSQCFYFNHSNIKVEGDALIVLTSNRALKKKMMRQYLGQHNWSKVYFISIPVNSNQIYEYFFLLYFRVILFFIQKKLKSVEELHFSSYNNLFQLVICGAFEKRIDKFFLLNDGMQQIVINTMRRWDADRSIRDLPLLYKIMGFNKPIFGKLHIVTPYTIESDRDVIVNIKLPDLCHHKVIKNEILFLGSPLVEVGILSFDDYLSDIKKVVSRYKNFHVKYVPHPKEDRSKLNDISTFIYIQENKSIFEEYLISSQDLPFAVISHYSTSLLNTHLMAPSVQIVYIPIAEERIKKNNAQEKMKVVYDYFRSIETPFFLSLDDVRLEDVISNKR